MGAGLAEEFARPGAILFLTARSKEALAETQRRCENKGAVVVSMAVDVTDRQGMRKAINEAMTTRTIDLVIANAGITGESGLDDALRVVDTNLNGTLHTIVPILDRWRELGVGGSVAIMSSLNGHVSVATSFMAGACCCFSFSSLTHARMVANEKAYATTKVGLRILGESLRASYERFDVCITVLCPGMTESRMVAHQMDSGIPMITGVVSLGQGARWMADAIRRGDPECGYPTLWFAYTRVVGSMPAWARDLFLPVYLYFDPYTPHSVKLEDARAQQTKQD